MDYLASFLNILPQEVIHLSILTVIYSICWYKSLFGGWCIDDDMGLAQFQDKWRPEYKDAQGNLVTELHVDYYNQETGKDKDGKPVITTFKNLQYNSSLGFPGAFMRWHRLHIGKKFTVIAKDKRGHEVYGFAQSPFRHHVWSLLIHYANILLVYNLLSHLFGSQIAFLSALLFSIHPVSNQCVAWISGINYLYSLFFGLLNFNLIYLTHDYRITIPLTVFFSFASGMTLLTGCFNWVILLVLGRPWEAFASACCAFIVFIRDGKGAVDFRKKNFKEQNMEASTFFNIRKIIVIFKTFWYYCKLIPFPIHLGLYHEYGYHYDKRMERFEWNFVKGIVSFIVLLLLAFNSPFIIQFSLLWMFVYWLVFSNIITANQFVVERYVFIPSLGFSIILSYLLGPGKVFFLILGLYMARTMMHLWTYCSQQDFYLSNWLNFRNSEVALGNLGVCYVNDNKAGMAMDTWRESTKLNPFYDVAWYNLYSILKTNGFQTNSLGMLEEAKAYLEKCLNAKTVHFRDNWKKEYEQLCSEINRRKGGYLV